MLNTRDASEVLERDFLETRCKILEVAAALDRIDRAPSHHHEHHDPRLGQIRQSWPELRLRLRFRWSVGIRCTTGSRGRRKAASTCRQARGIRIGLSGLHALAPLRLAGV